MERLEEVLRECVRLVVEHGHLVDLRTHYNYTIYLYSVNTYFFEIYYNEDTDKIVWIIKANDYDLNLYLDHVEIDFDKLLGNQKR
jgi:hypothetical protein